MEIFQTKTKDLVLLYSKKGNIPKMPSKMLMDVLLVEEQFK